MGTYYIPSGRGEDWIVEAGSEAEALEVLAGRISKAEHDGIPEAVGSQEN